MISKIIDMKKLFLVVFILMTVVARSQNNYKVVFDMTSKDSVNQQTLIRQLNGIHQASPDARLEVVVYSHGMNFVTKAGSTQVAAITQLLAEKNISFKVCAATMKRNNLTAADLIPGVQVVDDGIYEIVKRQQEGWGYIKVAH